MPLYEYACDACGHKFEKIQKFSDPLERQCPNCGGEVRKLMSSPAIQFKGSGFYITDYAKKDQAASAKADKAAGEKSEAGSAAEKSGKSDSSTKTETTSSSTSSGDSSSSTAASTTTTAKSGT
jgi:putative FmdB family regulatory protein